MRVYVILLLVVTLFSAAEVEAQSMAAEPLLCGGTCLRCGVYKFEGYITVGNNPTWEQTCDFNPIQNYCTYCESGDGVASDFVSAVAIASTLEALQRDQLSAVFVAYSHRIRINPNRYQVIITGTQCDKNAHGAILNVTRETWTRLRGLGAKTWEPTIAL